MSVLSSLPELLGAGSGTTPPTQDRGYELAWDQVRRSQDNQVFEAAADPTVSQWLQQLNLNTRPQIYWGRVVDGVAWANNLKVQLEGEMTPINCVMASGTSLRPIGVRELNGIGIDSSVYVLWHPSSEVGVILGVEPEFSTSGKAGMADFISQAGRSGLSVDLCHKSPFKTAQNGLISDRSAGRPFDATLGGEMGYITETGLCFTIDPFMVQMRVDEETGFFASYWDQYARVAGHNLAIWSAGSERTDEDDQSEFDAEHGYSPYIWETLGSATPKTTISREISADLWQQDPDNQQYSGVEPDKDNQAGWFRLTDFFGYYGQGTRRELKLPPLEDVEGVLTTPDNPLFPGAYVENLSLTGRKSISTMHEYIIAKRIYAPTSKRVKYAADPQGDTPDNYRFAGHEGFGKGEEHKIVSEIESNAGGTELGWVHADGFLDTQAFVFNWEALHPFHYHKEDRETNQESDLPWNCEPPKFTDLMSQQYLTVPSPIEIDVDHRYPQSKIYPNHSYWALLADGGSVWADGYGSEVRMTEGCLDLTAPGDVRLLAGRSVVMFAGKDIIERAKGSVDISATCHDVRIKAKHNFHCVTTDECSSMLFDCRAQGDYCEIKQGEDCTFGGILLKAKDSTVGVYAKHIELTTNGVLDGSIIFDADAGRVRTRADYIENFVNDAIFDIFVSGGVSICSVNQWWCDNAVICSPVRINGALAVTQCGWFGSNLQVANGHIFTSEAQAMNYLVQPLQGAPLATAVSVLNGVSTICSDADTAAADELNTLGQYGLCLEVEFSFRTVDQMKTSDWKLWETRWQQLARLTGQNPDTWTEEPVDFQGNPTYPYPGNDPWLGSTWMQLDLTLYDADKLQAKDRPDNYESPEFPSPTAEVPDGNYTIIYPS